MIVYCK